jgi:hypothetical protein
MTSNALPEYNKIASPIITANVTCGAEILSLSKDNLTYVFD